jgi:hypothetical protein
MANCCYYDLRAYGKTKTVDKAMEFIKSHSPEYEVHDEKLSEDGKTRDVYAHGWCKWSATCAWNLDKYAPFDELFGEDIDPLLKELVDERKASPSLLEIKDDISIELYTEECDMGFAEHYIIVNGEIKLDDTRHYEEIYDDETDDFIGHRGGFKLYDFDFKVDKQIPEYNDEVDHHRIMDGENKSDDERVANKEE